MNSVNIFIDNIEIFVKKNTTIIQACLLLKNKISLNENEKKKLEIPRFCFHQELEIAGNCRMCLVELKNSIKPVVSCALQVNDKMIIKTDTILVKKAREGVLEFLLINHPLDCPVCDQGGECDLQEQTYIFGIDKSRFNEFKRAIIYKTCSTFIKMVMTRCIHCTRCIRFLIDIAGVHNFCLVGRGNSMEVGQFINKNLKNELSGNIVDLCPVGALTSKSSSFKLRIWEIAKVETVDVLDNIGADIRVDLRGTEILRILPRLNQDVNNNWITDITRYSFDALTIQRFITPYYKEDIHKNKNNLLIKITWSNVLDLFNKHLFINKYLLNKKINYSFLSGYLSDSYTSLMIKNLSNSLGSSFIESRVEFNKKTNVDLRNYFITNWIKLDFKNIDIFIFVGLNLRLEAPLLNVKIRKLKKKKKILIFSFSFTANLLYHVKHVGLSSKNFLSFLEGKHYLSNYLINNNLNIYFLLGSSILRRKDCLSYIHAIEYLKKYYFKNILFGIIQLNIGRITSSEIGLIPGISYYNNNNSLHWNNNIFFKKALNYFFIFGGDDYLNLNFNNFNLFNLYIGFHGYSLFNNSHIILPSTSYFEKSTSYLNIEGVSRFSQSILKLLNEATNEWKLIFLLYLKIIKSENLLKYFNKFSDFNNYYFFNYYFYNKKNIWNTIIKKNIFFNKCLLIWKNFKNNSVTTKKVNFNNYYINYYLLFIFYRKINNNFIFLFFCKLINNNNNKFNILLKNLFFYSFLLLLKIDIIVKFLKKYYTIFLLFNYKKINLIKRFNILIKKIKKINLLLTLFLKNKYLSYNYSKSLINIKLFNSFDLKIFESKIIKLAFNLLDTKININFLYLNIFKLIFSILNKNVYNLDKKFNKNLFNINLIKFLLNFLLFYINCNYFNNILKINKNIFFNNYFALKKLIINYYLKNFKYFGLKGSYIFFLDNIENNINKQLTTYSRLFLLNNQYYLISREKNYFIFSLQNKTKIKFYINNYPLVSYIDNYYKINIISSLSVNITSAAIKYKYKILFSNYL